jgi:hypothetical protein
LGPGPRLIKKNLPGRGLIKAENHWCDIVVSNVHAPNEDKSDESKDNFYDVKISMENQDESLFSNQQSEMKVYMTLVMIMGLE